MIHLTPEWLQNKDIQCTVKRGEQELLEGSGAAEWVQSSLCHTVWTFWAVTRTRNHPEFVGEERTGNYQESWLMHQCLLSSVCWSITKYIMFNLMVNIRNNKCTRDHKTDWQLFQYDTWSSTQSENQICYVLHNHWRWCKEGNYKTRSRICTNASSNEHG